MFGSSVLNNRIRARVIVTTKRGDAFSGVLWEADKSAIVLRNAEQLTESTNPDPIAAPVDGELVVLSADVAYLQVL